MLVSGRTLGLFFVACSLAAEYMGGLGTIGVSERAFNEGMGVIWYHIAASTGILLFGLMFAHYYRKYGIQTIPTQIFFDRGGKEYYRHEGFMPREDIVGKLREMGVR